MDVQRLHRRLLETMEEGQLVFDAPMSRYTTLRLGGPADLLCEVRSREDIAHALTAARELCIPVTVLGNGSNLLVRDGGIRGLTLHVGDGFGAVSAPIPMADGRFCLRAQGGATLTKLSTAAAEAGLAGLSFACGIPGTVGGAVFMNAGAYGGEMKHVVSRVTVVMQDGTSKVYSGEDMRFGYRSSVLMQHELCVAAEVEVLLSVGDREAIRAEMRDFAARRREKQPITLPSCGSTFKRPEGHFAGTLIQQCGLKGARIGGASVSTLHAGFLLNDGGGTAADYLALIRHVQQTVREQTGVQLTPEVRIIGEDIA